MEDFCVTITFYFEGWTWICDSEVFSFITILFSASVGKFAFILSHFLYIYSSFIYYGRSTLSFHGRVLRFSCLYTVKLKLHTKRLLPWKNKRNLSVKKRQLGLLRSSKKLGVEQWIRKRNLKKSRFVRNPSHMVIFK